MDTIDIFMTLAGLSEAIVFVSLTGIVASIVVKAIIRRSNGS